MADASRTTNVYQKQDTGDIVAKSGGQIGRIGSASFTIGSESSDTINVAIQLSDPEGDDFDEFGFVWAYLSGDSGGDGVVSTAPTGGVSIGTDGSIIEEPTSGKTFLLQSENDGDIDVDITDTGTPTFHLVVILPDGTKAVSGAITFA